MSPEWIMSDVHARHEKEVIEQGHPACIRSQVVMVPFLM